jgi:hypothetical protein
VDKEDAMQETTIDTVNERDATTRSDEMREDQQPAPATTADIAAVDGDKMIEPATVEELQPAEVPEPAEAPEPAEEPPTEYGRAEAPEPGPTGEPDTTPLFDDAETGELRNRWTDVQTAFVDEPRTAVEQADALVADVMKRLATGFADKRKSLEGQWSRGDDVSTEDLRLAMRRYRSFFDRLLSV